MTLIGELISQSAFTTKTILRNIDTHDEKDFLNLGVNCHLSGKTEFCQKNTELELLYQDITRIEKDGKVVVSPDLRPQLLAEGTKRRGGGSSSILTPRLRAAAKSLREDDSIVIRKADKTAIYVILDKTEYLSKISDILSDEEKFERVRQNPTADLKKRVNALLKSANAVIGGVHFPLIIGEYHPGYLYGNVKIHKNGNPLRPIISQIPTPTYETAKLLNQLITPYIPTNNTLRSADEFLTVLKCNAPRGIIGSLDVCSLFTNVPVKATIDIILKYVYENNDKSPPSLSKNLLKQLLLVCTTEAPFRAPDGKLYVQKDGVAMGSPLGVLFANAYMCHVEEQVLGNMQRAPHVYKRYIDDIYVMADSEDDLQALRLSMEDASVLKFTYEVGANDKLPFLDVLVDNSTGRTATSVYRKKTDGGRCLNAFSECPQRYKTGVIRTYVRRALRTCSSWDGVDEELKHVKQMLVNNNYSNSEIDREISAAINDYMRESNSENRGHQEKQETLTLYYRNTMTRAYKQDERIIKRIVHHNVTATENRKIQLRIYYKNKRTSNLIMRNNMHREDWLQTTNVVYHWTCPIEDCKLQDKPVDYVGRTATTLSRRQTMNLHQHPPFEHMRDAHHRQITREDLIKNLSILKHERNHRRLAILEAVIIRERHPVLNCQRDYLGIFTLCSTHTYGGA